MGICKVVHIKYNLCKMSYNRHKIRLSTKLGKRGSLEGDKGEQDKWCKNNLEVVKIWGGGSKNLHYMRWLVSHPMQADLFCSLCKKTFFIHYTRWLVWYTMHTVCEITCFVHYASWLVLCTTWDNLLYTLHDIICFICYKRWLVSRTT